MKSVKTARPSLNSVSAVITIAVLLSGCASDQTNYGWSHEMSGDYLFAYDSTACAESTGNAAAPEFFACMERLGYFRIDPVTGARVASNIEPTSGVPDGESASLAAPTIGPVVAGSFGSD